MDFLLPGINPVRAGTLGQKHGLHASRGVAPGFMAATKTDYPDEDSSDRIFLRFGPAMGLLAIWWERYHQGTNQARWCSLAPSNGS